MTSLPSDSRPAAEVANIIEQLKKEMAAEAPTPGRGRLIFALDATASREPTWDKACHIQGAMFEATASLGGLQTQLLYYRGFNECKASRWMTSATDLHRVMAQVRCLGGNTQIARVLAHTVRETTARKVGAIVFVGDAMEEQLDELAISPVSSDGSTHRSLHCTKTTIRTLLMPLNRSPSCRAARTCPSILPASSG